MTAAAKIALADRPLQNEALERRETCRQLQFACGLLFDIGFEDDPVRSASLDLGDLETLLEIAQRSDPCRRALDLQRIERIALGDAELAAYDLVLRQRVAVDVDPLDIDPRRLAQDEGHVHREVFAAAVEPRRDVGKGVAEGASQIGQLLDRVLDRFGIVPVAALHRQAAAHRGAVKIAQLAFHLHIAEFVALAFLDHIGDDEIALIGGQFSHCRHNAKIGIALRQIKLPQLLLVEGQPVGIVAGVGAQEAEQPRFLGNHFATQIAVRKSLIADDVDLLDLGLGTFVDLENDIDAVLRQLDHLRLDCRRETALSLIQLDDPRDICADLGPGENLPRRQPDLGNDLVVLYPVVALEDDAVDHRILDHGDQHIAVLEPDIRRSEQFGGVELFEHLVADDLVPFLARTQPDVGEDGLRFQPLSARD